MLVMGKDEDIYNLAFEFQKTFLVKKPHESRLFDCDFLSMEEICKNARKAFDSLPKNADKSYFSRLLFLTKTKTDLDVDIPWPYANAWKSGAAEQFLVDNCLKGKLDKVLENE